MRKAIFLLVGICLFMSSFAITKPIERTAVKASQVFIPVGKNGERVSLLQLTKMKPRDVEKLTGKKMRFFDKVGFRIAQKKLRSSIKADGTFNTKRLQKSFNSDGSSGFHIGGFALGFFVGLIGVLIAYLINDDNKSNRVKWAWLGLLASLIFSILLIVAIL